MDRVALVGNPNVGKSVLFGFLTGHYATVSNYPGTTVEITRNSIYIDGIKAQLIDTPGVNTLIPLSEDERVTRDLLIEGEISKVIQVADAKNLRRALVLTLQLAEMGIPFLLDLNMEDELVHRGLRIDKKKLSEKLGVPVIGTVAIQKKGLSDLRHGLLNLKPSKLHVDYGREVEQAISRLEEYLPAMNIAKRALAVMLLSGDKTLTPWLKKLPDSAIEKLQYILKESATGRAVPFGHTIHQVRVRQINTLVSEVMGEIPTIEKRWLPTIGRLAMHPVWGFFGMGGVLTFFYFFVGKFGAQTAVGWMETGLFGKIINPHAVSFFSSLLSFSPFLRDFLVGPYGVITMALTYAFAIIFPIVTTFFIAFGLLEDSGYLPRLAVVLNRFFKWMGLNGKAVVPMVLGLGCDTMAVMTARIMDTKKERIILTLLLALGVPCSAQLGIILAMFAILPYWAALVWLTVVGGAMIATGFLAAKIIPGGGSGFVMEIPPLRKPSLINIVSKTMARLEWYLKEVVPLFIVGTAVLFFLDKLNWLVQIRDFSSPLVVKFLGLPPDATEAFLVGFLRRDYGATHFFDMLGKGQLTAVQATVALVVITLFIPCLANLLMIIKERGPKVATGIVGFIYPFAFIAGGLLNQFLRLFK